FKDKYQVVFGLEVDSVDYIRWSDLVFAVGFILGCIVCIYLVILIKNFNDSLRVFKGIFQANRDNIDETLKNLPVISKNLVEVSQTAKNELKAVESTLLNLNETAEATAATAQTIKNDIVSRAKNVIELIDLARKVFFKDREADNSFRQADNNKQNE
ncbi:MAG: hypothetical protein K6U74_17170, partial [Firmicutes bacterium]|nr:hypothetical protein [Bacillota bacterium]